MPKSRPAAASKPALMPARLASIAAVPLSAKPLLDQRRQDIARPKPSSRAAMPSAIMLGRPSGMAFAISFIGISTTRAPARGDARRQFAAARIADHQAVRSDLDLGAEAVGIEPVDADQQVEPVGQAFDRVGWPGAPGPPPRRRGSAGRPCGSAARASRRRSPPRAGNCRRSARRRRRCRRSRPRYFATSPWSTSSCRRRAPIRARDARQLQDVI